METMSIRTFSNNIHTQQDYKNSSDLQVRPSIISSDKAEMVVAVTVKNRNCLVF